MGGWHRSRPWPVLPPSPFGLRRTSRDGAARLLRTRLSAWDGRFCCKQQRIYKAHLMQTPDAFDRRAQFQLWIFSYTILLRSSKKLLSRLMIACAAIPMRDGAVGRLRLARPAGAGPG